MINIRISGIVFFYLELIFIVDAITCFIEFITVMLTRNKISYYLWLYCIEENVRSPRHTDSSFFIWTYYE